jgi:hypothetical protein
MRRLFRSVRLEELVEFVRANPGKIERRLSDDHREATAEFFERLEMDRRRRAEA